MNAERLLAHYERIADARDAIPRLRRFILDLAVRGKLVPQDRNDEPASELLKRIAAEKDDFLRSGSKVPSSDSAPFSIPQSWEWVPSTFPANVVSDMGKKIQTKDVLEEGRFPVVDQGKVLIRGYCNDENKVVKVSTPLILFGDHTRETKLIDFDFVVGADGVKLLRPICVSPTYYYLVLRWLPLDSRGYARHFKQLRASIIPMPPLAEQHRIVAKVNELMAQCDRLERARAEREARRDRLTTASLARLNAPDPETFHGDTRFALDVLPALTTRPDQIKQLRQTILNLAVRGKLVPQDPNDEPASELVKQIAEERAGLVKAGIIRREKPLPPLMDDEIQFGLPGGWAWVRLGNLSQFVTSGSRDWAEHYSNEGAIFVRMGNLSKDNYRLRLDRVQRVSPPADSEGTRTRLEAGDILISITGDVGMLGLIPEGFGEAYINQHTAMVRPVPQMKGRYLPELFRSPFAQDQFNEPQRGIKNSFRLTDVTQFVVPLPPLAEQHRIVARIDKLMALCDRLEASLATGEDTRRRILDALLAEALEPDQGDLEQAA